MAQMQNPNQRIETRAKLAQPETASSIEDLAHEVVNFHHVYQLPPALSALLESELSKSEINYRRDQGPGVSEDEVHQVANNLTEELKLPAYTRTTAVQIRTVRMSLALAAPSFMAIGIAAPDIKVGDSIQPMMSPLQAAHILGVLVDQKVMNADFQDPDIDTSALFQQRVSRTQSLQGNNAPTSRRVVHNPSQHSSEMRAAIASTTKSMSITDAVVLLDQILRNLHLK